MTWKLWIANLCTRHWVESSCSQNAGRNVWGDRWQWTSCDIAQGSHWLWKDWICLISSFNSGYRLFLPLPTRSLLEDQKEGWEIPQAILKIATRSWSLLLLIQGLRCTGGCTETGKRLSLVLTPAALYKGDVILTTIDKFSIVTLPGDKQKSSFSQNPPRENSNLLWWGS